MGKYTDAELFFNEFYELFDNDNSFTGSMEQVRLLIQFKINKFIHLNYVRKIFDLYKSIGLIRKSDTKTYIERKIGLKVFKNRKQFSYYKNSNINPSDFEVLKKKIIESLATDLVFEELSTKDLLNELREVEKLKNIEIDNFKYDLDMTRTYNQDFSDIEILYGVSKNKLLYYIESLKNWNKVKQDKDLSPEEAIRKNKQYQRKISIEEFYKNCFSLLNKSFEMDEFLYAELTQLCSFKSVPFCTIVLRHMEISDKNFISKMGNMNLNFHIDDIAVSKSHSTIILRDNNIDIEIRINKNFSSELEQLYIDYYNLAR